MDDPSYGLSQLCTTSNGRAEQIELRRRCFSGAIDPLGTPADCSTFRFPGERLGEKFLDHPAFVSWPDESVVEALICERESVRIETEKMQDR